MERMWNEAMSEKNMEYAESEHQGKKDQYRSITYEITAADANQKVSSFLKHKGYSTQNRVNLKKDEKSIRVNGVCVFQNAILRARDVLEVQIREQESSDGIIPVELSLEIVYEDEDLLVINKPAGMPIHPSLHNYDNSLGNALAWYFKKQDKPFVFRCINRLDRDTSGLTIVAKHMVSGAILSQMVAAKSKDGLEADGIHREYLAIVEGHVTPEQGVIDAPIARKESQCLERVVDWENGERAVTHYQVIRQTADYSLVALQLETGRTHQIRVHMSYLGYPLVGDFLYNPNYAGNQIDRVTDTQAKEKTADYPIHRQALHAHKISFSHPMTGKHMDFCVPMPDDMRRLVGNVEYL